MKDLIFCAIDTADIEQAKKLVKEISQEINGIKLGLEFFVVHGAEGVRQVMAEAKEGTRLFLDLKFHDIPNTVAGAVSSALSLQPDFMTIHASGGKDMIEAAVNAAKNEADKQGLKIPDILAVTVLTHLGESDLDQVGQKIPVVDQVRRLASLAKESGASGIVCSPHEVEMLRKDCGEGFILMVPGIRPAGADKGDQTRIMTPEQALDKGADYLVIGRPITQAQSPAFAVRQIVGSTSYAA